MQKYNLSDPKDIAQLLKDTPAVQTPVESIDFTTTVISGLNNSIVVKHTIIELSEHSSRIVIRFSKVSKTQITAISEALRRFVGFKNFASSWAEFVEGADTARNDAKWDFVYNNVPALLSPYLVTELLDLVKKTINQ